MVHMACQHRMQTPHTITYYYCIMRYSTIQKNAQMCTDFAYYLSLLLLHITKTN